jgi:hypothetical protein
MKLFKFLIVLQLISIVAKIFSVITWSWWIVLIPSYLTIILAIALCLMIGYIISQCIDINTEEY